MSIEKGCEELESSLNRLLAHAAVARRAVLAAHVVGESSVNQLIIDEDFATLSSYFAGTLNDISDRLAMLRSVLDELAKRVSTPPQAG